MSSLAVSALRELVERDGEGCDAPSARRVQGRPTRGANEVGSQKIVEGMRVALRAQKTTNVTRKDIALHADVTPALVTYYFPERSSLIEAATLPIVQALIDKVKACTERDGAARQNLVEALRFCWNLIRAMPSSLLCSNIIGPLDWITRFLIYPGSSRPA